MKNVQNLAYADSELVVSGRQYKGDATGVFAMMDDHADMLAATPGWALTDAEPVADYDPAETLHATTPIGLEHVGGDEGGGGVQRQ